MTKIHVKDIFDLKVLQSLNYDELLYTKSTIDEELIKCQRVMKRMFDLVSRKLDNDQSMTYEENCWLERNKDIISLIQVQERNLVSIFNYLHELIIRKSPTSKDKELDKKIDESVKDAVSKEIKLTKGVDKGSDGNVKN